MSLTYKLFGKPVTIGEFIDKSLQTEKRDVEIKRVYNSQSIGGGASFHHYKIMFKGGAGSLKVDGASSTSVLGYTEENNLRDYIAKNNSLVRAIEIAEFLEQRGLHTSIEGKTREELEEELNQYKQEITSLSKKYDLPLDDSAAPFVASLTKKR